MAKRKKKTSSSSSLASVNLLFPPKDIRFAIGTAVYRKFGDEEGHEGGGLKGHIVDQRLQLERTGSVLHYHVLYENDHTAHLTHRDVEPHVQAAERQGLAALQPPDQVQAWVEAVKKRQKADDVDAQEEEMNEDVEEKKEEEEEEEEVGVAPRRRQTTAKRKSIVESSPSEEEWEDEESADEESSNEEEFSEDEEAIKSRRTSPRKAKKRESTETVTTASPTSSEEESVVEAEIVSEAKDDSTQATAVEVPPAKRQASPKEIPPAKKKKVTSSTKKMKQPTLFGAKEPEAKAPAKKRKAAAPKKTISKASSTVSSGYDKQPYAGGAGLPIIKEPQLMFDDMINVKLSEAKAVPLLRSLIEKLHNRPIRVATMCSGTESPVLALDMLQQAIRECVRDDADLNFEPASVFPLQHVFSCEIEPYKQAYIERNFHPPLLFRDIRELGQDKAYTAYGGLVSVPNTPGCVDILIAGTSCVDYSNLNTKRKEIDQKGESGQTFYGMTDWIEKAQPPIVIIENVYGAPWAKKVEIFENLGYASTFLRLDTKDFYIPHTRQRGYLFAVRKSQKGMDAQKPQKWAKLVSALKRQASASLDEFMLPNDDPRVLRGRARLTAESLGTDGDRAGRTDWSKCETRHQNARSLEELGDKRPFTDWSDSSKVALPGYCWNEWMNAQVHRIHDLMDINTLRLAKAGMDPTYKTMVWNLSQNVDRDTMGKLGLCQCLTPTGVPYVTNRGGPLVGEELLLLQGIPADDLLLTKETEDNLKDLAGNAMSTTVVGACTLCALLVGQDALSPDADTSSSTEVLPTLVPRSLVPPSEVTISKEMGDYEEKTLNLGPSLLNGLSSWQALLSDASSSSRMCVSEGAEEALPFESLVVCKDCGQKASTSEAFPPRKYEEHNFVPLDTSKPRVQPSEFRKQLSGLLPMQVHFTGFDNLDDVDVPNGVASGLWNQWLDSVKNTVSTSQKTPSEFRLSQINRRSNVWIAVFKSREEGRLEARISATGVAWLLFAKLPDKEGALKEILQRPIARLSVEPPVDDTEDISLLKGQWCLNLPVKYSVSVIIEGAGDRVSSWRNRLGLKGPFEREEEYETLKVTLEGDHELKSMVEGEYKLLSKCGGACGSLRRRLGGPESGQEQDMFFFLNSGRKTLPQDDSFVFASTCHRTSNGEYREVSLEIDPEQEYRPICSSSSVSAETTVRAIIPGKWVTLNGVEVSCKSDVGDKFLKLSQLKSFVNVPNDTGSWKTCPELLSCSAPATEEDKLFAQCVRSGGSLELNLEKSKHVLEQVAYVTTRLTVPDLFPACQWLSLSQTATGEGLEKVCPTCAPARPEVKWTHVAKGGRSTFLPIEDGREAALYERALKLRPHPWVVRFSASDRDGLPLFSMQIGCNAVSLAQRALGLLPPDSFQRKSMISMASENPNVDGKCTLEWRVVEHVEKVVPDFPLLTFTSNKLDVQAKQPPNFSRFPLRKEQLRSLTWMLQQESSSDPFFEEEVTEEVMPGLNWRAEGRVHRPVNPRGGIIADEVGYGKTAITLGLIDSATAVNGPAPAPPEDYRKGRIYTKATLVLVPKHLMGQWPEEINKFLRHSKRVVVIKDMTSINSNEISDYLTADIVVASFAVLSNENYFKRLARLCGLNPASLPSGSSGGRHFNAIYHEMLSALSARVSQIKNDCSSAYGDITSSADSHGKKEADGSLRLDGKKTVYKQGDAKSKAASSKLKTSERDPWGLSTAGVKNDYRKMKSPPLEMFFWNRIVVDEFTYLESKERDRLLEVIHQLNSCYRWFLSGTPKHATFNDVQILSNLLGIHLGVNEALPGEKVSKKWLAEKETTGLESLSHFLENRSVQWHERRHCLAQAFLDRFVRQNIAEIDEIPYEEHCVVVELPPVERAIYLELETHLKSLDMNHKNALKSKKRSSGDRESRMQRILQGSSTGEEALLKCCSHFNMTSETYTALQTIEDIIRFRESEKNKLESEMTTAIAAAFRQRHRILHHQPDWLSITETGKGEVRDSLGVYLDLVKKKQGVPHGSDEEIHLRVEMIVERALSEFEANPSKVDAAFREVNGEDEDPEGESPRKKPKKEKSMKAERLFEMKQALRNHMHGVRSLAKELCGRVRSLRYIEWIRNFQKETCLACVGCKAEGLQVGSVGVLSCCGHVGCLTCLGEKASDGKCIESTCDARVSSAHVVSADRLGLERNDASGGRFGRKLSAIVDKVKEIITQDDDRLIVFCQFDDLKEKVKEALKVSGVASLEVEGTVVKQMKTIALFQKDKPNREDPRVLLLKMDDEESCGLNLTNLNHAIFVHPLLADSQQEYEAYETQAIGRIRRFGQEKVVHVWRFLAASTIDTEIFSQRVGGELPPVTEE